MLTPAWTPIRWHAEQQRLWRSNARFRVCPAGRRSGKTMLAKRYTVKRALNETEVHLARFILTAPTYAQAKEIFWEDMKALIPKHLVHKIRESDLTIQLINGSRIMVAGLDRPARIEGSPIRGIVIDEYANCPTNSWIAHIRPALSTEGCIGWAWLIGVPEGRGPYHKMYLDGMAKKNDEWDSFTWFSSDILAASEIAALKAEMDARMYRQECEGSFESFEGKAYYSFGTENVRPLKYDPSLDLIFTLDFNISPGTASVIQEQEIGTCIIGEVWIQEHSNTPLVCRHLVEQWGSTHKGTVVCRGDKTGGAKHTSSTEGSDWDLVRNGLEKGFEGEVLIDLPSQNPPERDRVNAMNARLCTADGNRHLFVDGQKAPHVLNDIDSVAADNAGCLVKPKSGEGRFLTHLTDGIGYHIQQKYPISSGPRGGVIRHG